MPPPTRVQDLAEAEQIALVRAATVMQHEQTGGIIRGRPLLEGQGVHAYILLARLARRPASHDWTAAVTAGRSVFRL